MTTRPRIPNQLHRDLMGVNSLNPFDGEDSSSRKQMFSSHIGQALVIKGATERRIQTGMEREYAKYTFSTKMPTDAYIIKVIDRHRPQIGADSIEFNPQTVVIYEDVHTKRIGVVNLAKYCSHHQYFGFEYRATDHLQEVRPGNSIAKDTVLLDSPSVTHDGGYRYGVELNMAFMSHPAVSEDGVMICSDVLNKLSIKTYEHRVVEWGSKRFPMNLYGDETTFKAFPDIGEYVRDDGMLMCLRSYDKDLAVVEQGIHDLQQPDYFSDNRTYAAGAGGRVVDIRVQHDGQPGHAPTGMDAQPEKYDRARRQFYREILAEYNRLRHDRGERLEVTPEFHRLIVEALAVLDQDQQRIVKLYRQAPLDDWRVEFVIEYNITPTIGFKVTDCHGGKGVICYIAKPEEMPVDEAGNRADVVMDPNSTISRMNLGRLYEQYLNAASRDVSTRVRQLVGLEEKDHKAFVHLTTLESNRDDRFEKAWNYLMGYYEIVSPKMYVWLTGGDYKQTRATHLASVVREGVYLYMPPDNAPELEDIITDVEKHYRPTYGQVSYIGYDGRRVLTKNPVRIGSVYMMLLEKIADDWTAVSSGKLQHFGVLSQVTNTDKFSQPTRTQAIRAWGESEVRIAVSYVGPYFVVDMLDRNNNPATHRQILQNLLRADQPTNVKQLVERSTIPLGGAKPLQLIKHIAECSGWKFVYSRYTPSWQHSQQPGHKQ